jgi:hypothetical protein
MVGTGPTKTWPATDPTISAPLIILFWGVTPRSEPLLRSGALSCVGSIGEADSGGAPSCSDLAEALSEIDAEAVVIDGDPADRLENVMAALAADRHVLAYPPLAPDDEDVQRCAFIALNRGVRLMIADSDLHPDSERLAEAFRDYALDGIEPPSSARRWLTRAAQTGGSSE